MNAWDYVGKGMTADEIEEAVQEESKQFDPFAFGFVINPYRVLYRVSKPIKCSAYAKELFKVGAGWK